MLMLPKYSEYEIDHTSMHSVFEMVTPFKDAVVSLEWCNKEYPIVHDHTHWELTVILNGEIEHYINDEQQELKRGDVCLIRPSDRHCLKYKKGFHGKYEHINLGFKEEVAKQIISTYGDYEELKGRKQSIHFTLDDLELINMYDKALLAQNLAQEQYETITKLLISRILISFFEQDLLFEPDYPDWFNLFLVEISKPSNFDKSVKELAEETAYSYSRLSRLFKQYTGRTIVSYVNEKKMIYAKRLLRTTNLKTLQIAEEIGFSSLSSFNHLFKKAYKLTPIEYRRIQRIEE